MRFSFPFLVSPHFPREGKGPSKSETISSYLTFTPSPPDTGFPLTGRQTTENHPGWLRPMEISQHVSAPQCARTKGQRLMRLREMCPATRQSLPAEGPCHQTRPTSSQSLPQDIPSHEMVPARRCCLPPDGPYHKMLPAPDVPCHDCSWAGLVAARLSSDIYFSYAALKKKQRV